MKIGYMRVSTAMQNMGRQEEILKEYGLEKIFKDTTSGKNCERPGLVELLDYVREGDTVYVTDYSRIARTVQDLLNIVDVLKRKNVNLISVKEGLDLNTPQGKLHLTILGAVYEFERALIKERQLEGIALAKAQGKYKGRQRIKEPDNLSEVMDRWIDKEITGVRAMKELNLTRSTFYKMANLYRRRLEEAKQQDDN